MKINKKILLIIILCEIMLLVVKFQPFLFFNVSESLPRGVYQILPLTELKKGDIVIFQRPKNCKELSRYMSNNHNLLMKKVGAIEGDIFEITDEKILVNGEEFGEIFLTDFASRPLPILRGKFVVPDDEFLPLSDYNQRSFDGRYFGTIPKEKIIGKARLIFNWRGENFGQKKSD